MKSRSLLKPIFEFSKIQKSKKGIDVSKLKYNSWKENNLSINLEKNTTVLNISYRDKEKELVIPVIKKISDAYQDYSGRQRRKGLSQGLNYLNNQIKIYNQKSNESIKNFQEFAIENLSLIHI